MPLMMTSFLWSHIAHNMVKTRLQSVSLLTDPSMREFQKALCEDATSRATPAAFHASWTNGHVKNRWEQSSSSPTQRGQLPTAPRTMRQRMALVIRWRRSRSQPKSRIFIGSRCFHTTQQHWMRETTSRGPALEEGNMPPWLTTWNGSIARCLESPHMV